MSIALYRKYRSATFADLIGQEHVATTLRNQVRRSELAHAYLFAGIRGTGKTSTARILARAVCCLDLRDGEPCNACAACEEILGGGAVDVLEIDAASNRGIDEMRDLREKVKFLPASLRAKVYIIDEAHMLTTEAWNAFLKTLEEPPDHVLFVLATTEPHKVPETVRSRVQRFDFRRVDGAAIAAHLGRVAAQEGAEVEDDAIDLLARAGQGSVRDALSLLDQALAAGERPLRVTTARRALGLADPATIRSALSALAAGDAARALRAVAEAFDAGADARQLLRELARLARGAELLAVGYAEGADLGPEDEAVCRELAAVAGTGLWVDALDRFGETEINLRQPVDARLQVELCLLRLTRPGSTGGPVAMPSAPEAVTVQALAARVAALEAALGRGADTAAERRLRLEAVGAALRPTAPGADAPPGALPAGDVTERSKVAPSSAPAAEPPSGTGAHADGPSGASPSGATAGTSAAGPSPEGGAAGSLAPTTPVAAPDPPAEPAAGDDAALEEWRTRWPTVIDAVNRRDPMLAGVLRTCMPAAAGPGRLVVGAPYGFHLEKLQEQPKARLLTEVAAELAGGPVTVEAVFSGDDRKPASPPAAQESEAADATRAALAAFPGSRVTGSRLRDTSYDAPVQRPGPA